LKDAPQSMTSNDRIAEMGESLSDLGRNAKAQMRRTESFTRERPKTALGVAFIVGLATGGLVVAAWSLSNQRSRRLDEFDE